MYGQKPAAGQEVAPGISVSATVGQAAGISDQPGAGEFAGFPQPVATGHVPRMRMVANSASSGRMSVMPAVIAFVGAVVKAVNTSFASAASFTLKGATNKELLTAFTPSWPLSAALIVRVAPPR